MEEAMSFYKPTSEGFEKEIKKYQSPQEPQKQKNPTNYSPSDVNIKFANYAEPTRTQFNRKPRDNLRKS